MEYARHSLRMGSQNGFDRGAEAQSASPQGAVFEKPARQSIAGASCRNDGKGTFNTAFPPTADASHPYLAFGIGPGVFMADESHANKAPFHGAGTYTNVLSSGNSGSSRATLFAEPATVVVNADGR